MFKITAIVSLMLIATWSQADSRRFKREAASSRDYDTGSTLWAASLSCDSCGSECASACGTRHFRSCCFNYLRKKRGPDNFKFPYQNIHEWTPENLHKTKLPYIIEDPMDPWNIMQGDFKNYPYDETMERLQNIYES